MRGKKISLEEHQEIIYELLYTLDDFCREHKIKYFLAHGTLLGAIRHKGIIPWDDDADVMMERSEYERFLEIISKNTPNGYEIYSIDNTKGYYFPFAKFGKSKTLLFEPFKYFPKKGIGVNIDIFPIDGCPNDFDEARKYVVKKRNRIWEEMQFRFYADSNYVPGLKWKLYFYTKFQICRLHYFQKKHLKAVYSEAKEYSLKDSKYFFSFWTFNGAKNLHQTKSIEKLIYVPFGKKMLPVPVDYDTILREEYDDYMTPPSDHRSTHEHGDVYLLLDD